MADSPNRSQSSGSDLPRPKNHQPGKVPVQRQQPRRNYGSDTMQFTAPQFSEEYDAAYEQRRAASAQNRPSSSDRPSQNRPPQRPAQADRPQQNRPQNRPVQPGRPPQQGRPAPQQRHAAPPPPPKKKRRRKTSLLGRVLRGIAALAAGVFLLYSVVALLLIGRLEKIPKADRTVTSGALEESYVRSILLIGTDARDVTTEKGRSDSMILVSLNSRTDTMYLTSFMRDAYVEIPGHGSAKLNAAYSFGGAELLMDTLELNYGVSIDDYLCVSFVGFAGVIDAFGGVEITLSDSEAKAVNDILLSEVNELMGDAADSDFLQGGGTYVLDGKQALSYSRIRYVGNADFERTSRQREVMTQLFANLKTRAATAVPKLISSALPHVGTNMSTGEMYFLSLRAPSVLGYEIEQIQIPADGTWSGQTVDGQSVLVVDFAENTQILQDTVYAEAK